MEIEHSHTERGFPIATFEDAYHNGCSIQISSIADYRAIWFGIDDPDPKILIKGEGWTEYPLPKDVSVTTRMHLNMDQVRALIPILENFAQTGEIDG